MVYNKGVNAVKSEDGVIIEQVKENRPYVKDVLDTRIMKKYQRTIKEKYSSMNKEVRLEDVSKLVPTKSGYESFRRVLLVIDVDTGEVLKEVLIG